LRVGNFFEPFSLERVTPNRWMTFMERSLIDEAFVPARNLGTMTWNTLFEERMSYAIGVFRTGSDEFADDVGDDGEQAVTARLTGLLWYDEPSGGRYYAHLGGAYSFRDEDEGFALFRARPEIRMRAFGEGEVPFFVDTGRFEARNHQLFGAEALWVHGPFSLQSEFVAVPVTRIGQPNPFLYGGYVYASYFLTGEHRPYRKANGTVDRPRPFENFFRVPTERGAQMGKGAWEIAARFSYIDLDDQDIQGGKLNEYTFGLNWYLNAYTRITLNYIHSELNRAPVGPSAADSFGLRVGYDF
jgi:phosphate-selective porin OprO/OprP